MIKVTFYKCCACGHEYCTDYSDMNGTSECDYCEGTCYPYDYGWVEEE